VTDPLRWFKSSYSSDSGGECLEAAIPLHTDGIRIRDSKDTGGPMLTVSDRAWTVFLAALAVSR
jgi:hypothetical protein